MFIYRVVERTPPRATIIEQSENAYKWLREAEIAAIQEIGAEVPRIKHVWEKENSFTHFTYFGAYRIEVIEAFVTPLGPFQLPGS